VNPVPAKPEPYTPNRYPVMVKPKPDLLNQLDLTVFFVGFDLQISVFNILTTELIHLICPEMSLFSLIERNLIYLDLENQYPVPF
jgi:hypothetical protein